MCIQYSNIYRKKFGGGVLPLANQINKEQYWDEFDKRNNDRDRNLFMADI